MSLAGRDDKGSWVLREARELGFRPKETREYIHWCWGLSYVGAIAMGVSFILIGLFFLIVLRVPMFGVCFPLFGSISIINGLKRLRMIDREKKKRNNHEKL